MVIKETCVARALRRLVLCVVFICRKQSSVDKLRRGGRVAGRWGGGGSSESSQTTAVAASWDVLKGGKRVPAQLGSVL